MWKYKSGDKYDLKTLQGFKSFFEKDLENAKKELARVKRFEKYGLPGYRWMVVRCQVGVDEAYHNIKMVNQAIEENS